jgi:hypothetical protein
VAPVQAVQLLAEHQIGTQTAAIVVVNVAVGVGGVSAHVDLEMFTNKRCFYFISFIILSKYKKCAPYVHNKVLFN